MSRGLGDVYKRQMWKRWQVVKYRIQVVTPVGIENVVFALMYIIHMHMLMVKIVVKLERIVIISGI